MNNSFYDDRELREIDEQISEVIGQPTLVDQMQERNDKAQSAKKNWGNEIKQYLYIYVPLLVSSVFTTMLGLYMGLAPYVSVQPDGSQTITFNTDWGHILTATVYVVAFVFVTEVAFAIFHHLFHKREDSNSTQAGTMLFGMILAGISIIGTGVSGGMVISGTLGFLSEFKEVPAGAQKWVVAVIPVMLGLYAGLFTAYKLSSRRAKAERIARENEEKLDLDQQVRMRGIQAIGKRRIQAAAIKMYEEMVMRGLLSPNEADWALNSGLSLAEIEKKLGRDLTGEGRVGDTSGLNRPVPTYNPPADNTDNTPAPTLTTPPTTPAQKPTYRHYTLEQFMDFVDMTKAQAYNMLQGYDFQNPGSAYHRLKQYEMLPDDMSFANFRDLYQQLIAEMGNGKVPVTDPRTAGQQ